MEAWNDRNEGRGWLCIIASPDQLLASVYKSLISQISVSPKEVNISSIKSQCDKGEHWEPRRNESKTLSLYLENHKAEVMARTQYIFFFLVSANFIIVGNLYKQIS